VNVLVDTSVWAGHLRQRDERVVALLEAGLVVCHTYVVVEVACGTPPRRSEIIDLLSGLESVPVATHAELLALIRQRALFGRGSRFVDNGLLASALLSDQTLLWALDLRLQTVAGELGRAYRPAVAS
jgi:predicted nucleic acid-binding protein